MQPEAPAPLDHAQLELLGKTRVLRGKLRFAGFIAVSNVIMLGLFAVLSIVFALLDFSVPLMGLALAGLAWNEERGRRALLASEPSASRRLAHNQLLLLGAVLIYCGYGAYQAWTGPTPLEAALAADPSLPAALDQAAGDVGSSLSELNEWGRVAALVTYGVVAFASLVVQGLTALYYRSLAPTLRALADVPAWARALS